MSHIFSIYPVTKLMARVMHKMPSDGDSVASLDQHGTEGGQKVQSKRGGSPCALRGEFV